MSGSVLSVYNPWEKLVMRSPLEIQWLGLSTFTAAAWLHSLVGELRSCRSVQCSLNKQIKVNYGNTSCLAFFQGVKYGKTYRPAVVKNFKLPCFVGINERFPFFFSFAFKMNLQLYLFIIQWKILPLNIKRFPIICS